MIHECRAASGKPFMRGKAITIGQLTRPEIAFLVGEDEKNIEVSPWRPRMNVSDLRLIYNCR